MSFKAFEEYIKECEKNKIVPSLRGAALYKKFGIVK